MLRFRQITKIYQTKGGTETRALDNVSVSFGETGMVFLLGKSGSGKSTMLNLAGGLDEPTHGEIVIMGKSSKNFSGSYFDSYRNTFVGFVFQEYNVLDEFTVEENVALALELQGKTKSGDKVREILDEVGLGEFAGRKPNTLSGGQKQRVAIARALVKEPKIILADEPTGALDSETGKQVFETLKKLSQTRLVIVVSHDREFAETYGDRIIELKDGKIISDVSRTDGNGANGATSKKQGELSHEEMFAKMRAFLKSGEGDSYEDFVRANQKDGHSVSAFAPTEEPTQKEYDESETKFIRSRLPAKKAIKMGASGLKLKPFRLIMTVLLSVVSFMLFGLASTMMLYNEDEVLLNSFIASDCEYLIMGKHYEVRETYDTYTRVTYPKAYFTPEEVSSYGEEAIGAFDVNIRLPENIRIPFDMSMYYQSEIINRVTVLPEEHALRQNLTGAYPTELNEIAVSSFFLDYAKSGTFRSADAEGNILNEKTVRTAEDLIGEYVVLSTWNRKAPVRITGVFDSGDMPAKYNVMKRFYAQKVDNVIQNEYNDFREEGLFTLALASEAFVEAFIDSNKISKLQYFDEAPQSYRSSSEAQTAKDWGFTSKGFRIYRKDTEPLRRIFLTDEGITELENDQLILPLDGGVASHYMALAELNGFKSDPEYVRFHKAQQIVLYNSYLSEDGRDNVLPTDEERDTAPEVVRQYLIDHPFSVTMQVYLGNFDYLEVGTYRVVGAYVNGDIDDLDGFYCSPTLYDRAMAGVGDGTERDTLYVREEGAVYDSVIIPIASEQMLKSVLSKIDKTDPDTDIVYRPANNLYNDVIYANNIVGTLYVVFLWVGVVLAVFAALLLFNFISMSISNKKKEIGILRAMGARGADVFKIFFSESGIIVGICIVFAVLGTFLVTVILNGFIHSGLGLPVALFSFGALSVVLMVAVAAVVAFVGTFLPVWFTAKKKPVDSIRAL